MFSVQRDGYEISTDPSRLDIAYIHRFLSEDSYWAKGRSLELVQQSIAHSLNFGVYASEGQQVGFARVVTDYTIFGWIGDVFIDPGQRGKGLGKWLVETITTHPELAGVRRLLLQTSDAHGLYRDYGGFQPIDNPERWMTVRRF